MRWSTQIAQWLFVDRRSTVTLENGEVLNLPDFKIIDEDAFNRLKGRRSSTSGNRCAHAGLLPSGSSTKQLEFRDPSGGAVQGRLRRIPAYNGHERMCGVKIRTFCAKFDQFVLKLNDNLCGMEADFADSVSK